MASQKRQMPQAPRVPQAQQVSQVQQVSQAQQVQQAQQASQMQQTSQTQQTPTTSKVPVNTNVYTSPYTAYTSADDDYYYLPASPPPTKEEESRIRAEKEKYLENDVNYPHVDSANKYKISLKIGQGTFGEVFQATLIADQTKEVAMKKILMQKESNGFPITASREIRILKSLKHINIVNLIEIVQTKANNKNNFKSTFYMVFEFCDHDLSGLLADHAIKFSLSEIKGMLHQLFSGVYYMHTNKILHRDMKSSNILITKDGVLKIADFGLARPYSDPKPENSQNQYTNCVVTIWYRPPELLLGERDYGSAIDMWGVGCIMAELWTRTPLLQGSTDQNQLNLITQICGSITPEVWPKVVNLNLYNKIELPKGHKRKIHEKLRPVVRNGLACDLLDKLLTLDPERRISANDALDHDFFWKEPFPCDLSKLMSTIKTNNLEFLVKSRLQSNRNNLSTTNKSSQFSTGFPDRIF